MFSTSSQVVQLHAATVFFLSILALTNTTYSFPGVLIHYHLGVSVGKADIHSLGKAGWGEELH